MKTINDLIVQELRNTNISGNVSISGPGYYHMSKLSDYSHVFGVK